MERKAGRVSRKAVVSILAEFISAPMVRKAKSGREIFHQLRNNLILDVGGSEKCPNGVHRGRNPFWGSIHVEETPAAQDSIWTLFVASYIED